MIRFPKVCILFYINIEKWTYKIKYVRILSIRIRKNETCISIHLFIHKCILLFDNRYNINKRILKISVVTH